MWRCAHPGTCRPTVQEYGTSGQTVRIQALITEQNRWKADVTLRGQHSVAAKSRLHYGCPEMLVIGVAEIHDTAPHRHPMLLIDQVTKSYQGSASPHSRRLPRPNHGSTTTLR